MSLRDIIKQAPSKPQKKIAPFVIFYWDWDAAPDGDGYYLHKVETQFYAGKRGYLNHTRNTAISDAQIAHEARTWPGIAVYCGLECIWGRGVVFEEQAKQRMQRIIDERASR